MRATVILDPRRPSLRSGAYVPDGLHKRPRRRPVSAPSASRGKRCDRFAGFIQLEGHSQWERGTPMTAELPDTALELRSLVTSDGTLELSLHDVPVPTPGANEVLVRVEASPINPSDLG